MYYNLNGTYNTSIKYTIWYMRRYEMIRSIWPVRSDRNVIRRRREDERDARAGSWVIAVARRASSSPRGPARSRISTARGGELYLEYCGLSLSTGCARYRLAYRNWLFAKAISCSARTVLTTGAIKPISPPPPPSLASRPTAINVF